MFHKEGHKIILITLFIVVLAIFIIDGFISIEWLRKSLMLLVLVFFVLILQFFRNPKRLTHANENQALSPVDGKVVVIEEVFEKEVFNDKRIQVSVFMSPLNVHVTRYPTSGKVTYSKYLQHVAGGGYILSKIQHKQQPKSNFDENCYRTEERLSRGRC